MSEPAFEIEITSQGWLDDDEEWAKIDLCSHGEIRLVIGGEVISAGDDERDFTISTGALQLLRTLESDHKPWADGSDQLIPHCGQLSMMSCPIRIDWRVSHIDDRVFLSDVVRVDDRGEMRFSDLAVELRFDDYRRQIVAFAEKAKEPFAGVEKEFDEDDYDRELYPKFWAEYDGLLARHTRN